MSENLFNYNPIQEWTGDVVDFGLPTIEGNTKITAIVTSALNAGDATQQCFKMAKESDYFALASDPATLTLVRYFFSGKSELLEQLSIASVQSFIETNISGSGVSSPQYILALIDTDDNGYLNVTQKYIQKCDVIIDKLIDNTTSMTPIDIIDIQYTPVDAPQGLNATDADSFSPGVVLVSWDPVLNVESYNVYRSTNKNAFDFFDNNNLTSKQTLITNTTNTNFNDTSLDNIGTFFYWVTALYLDPWDNGHCSDSAFSSRTDCESSQGTWNNIPAFCDNSVWTNQTDCETAGNSWTDIVYYCTNSDFTDQSSCESPRGTWTVFLRESLLAPSFVQCSISEGCSLPEFTTQFTCEDSNTCVYSVDDSEFLTHKMNASSTWLPAFNNETKCESVPGNNGGSTGCYYSSDRTTWKWSAANNGAGTEYNCTTTYANSNSGTYYIWWNANSTQWTGDSGNWITDVWSPELCQSSGGIWNFALPGEEGSLAGDQYIELVDNLNASENESNQITISWTSNPTVDPLIGECAECLSGSTVMPITTNDECDASGNCSHSIYDNQENQCTNNGQCFDAGLTRIRYSGYTPEAFDNNLNWFETANVISTTLVPNVSYGDDGTDYFAFRIIGYFIPQYSGNYSFLTNSDDSSWLWIGEISESLESLEIRRSTLNAIIDNSGSHPATVQYGNKFLTAGETYPILIYYGEGVGSNHLDMQFQPPGQSLTYGTSSDFKTTNYTFNSTSACESIQCSNTYWTTSSTCLAAGTCSYSTWNNQQTNCQNRGECYHNDGWLWSNDSYKGNITQSQCNDYDNGWPEYVNWNQNNWQTHNNSWQQQHTWYSNSFVSDNYNWNTYPQWNDPSICVSNNSSWVPDIAIQNTPDSYNIYRATETQHLAIPQEYTFIKNIVHTGTSISPQEYIDTSNKIRYALYYYKVTQISGGVESDFSIHDTGYQNV